MARLTSFTFISLNGYYKGYLEDISWHQHGEDEARFSLQNLKSGNTLLFGRKTFEMMQSFWTSEMAHNSFPEIARLMNDARKIVVSKVLDASSWNNTTFINKNLLDQIRSMKESSKNDLTILGSGSLLKQLTHARLIDEYQIMLDPIFIKNGYPMLNNLSKNLELQLSSSEVFDSGIILMTYQLKNK